MSDEQTTVFVDVYQPQKEFEVSSCSKRTPGETTMELVVRAVRAAGDAFSSYVESGEMDKAAPIYVTVNAMTQSSVDEMMKERDERD